MKILIWLGLISWVAIGAAEEGATAIFNGEDLTGWYGHDPHKTVKLSEAERLYAVVKQQAEFESHWRVEAGELVNDGQGPYATSAKEYGDVEFTLEYKTVALADSGVYLRGTPQVQIWDTTEAGGKWERGADKGSGGLFNNTAGAPGRDPLELADRPFGEWNALRIRMAGGRTWVWLNGKATVEAAIWEDFWDKTRVRPLAARGPIHLQTHGGEIRWRNLEVREIGSEEATGWLRGDDEGQGFEALFNGVDLTGWAGAVENYEVVDGGFRCREGMGGTLFSEEVFGDFVLRLEFLLPPGGNNGIAVRYPGTGNAAYDGFCELQVLDDTAEIYEKLDPRQHHGSAYGIAPAHRGYLRPVRQWNYQEVTVEGTRVRVELNGTVILDADLGGVKRFMNGSAHPGLALREGHLGFAGHKDPVTFRRIAVKRLGGL